MCQVLHYSGSRCMWFHTAFMLSDLYELLQNNSRMFAVMFSQLALLSGVKALSKFIGDPTIGFAAVVQTQLSFLCNENEVKVHLRKLKVDYDGNPIVSIPKLFSIINPSYDFIQVVVSSSHS